MDEFPFSREDWDRVRDSSLGLVNATMPEREELHRVRLFAVLDELEAVYGEHPVLTETRADFSDLDEESIRLYRRAIDLAEANDLPTCSIRLSLASALLDAGDAAAAVVQLEACEGEGDHWDRDQWAEYMARVRAM